MAEAKDGDVTAAVAAAKADLAAPRREFLFRPPKALEAALTARLNDPRDAPLLFCLFNITVCVVPSVILVFLLPASHLLGASCETVGCCSRRHSLFAWAQGPQLRPLLGSPSVRLFAGLIQSASMISIGASLEIVCGLCKLLSGRRPVGVERVSAGGVG